MKDPFLLPADLLTGTWLRMRAELVRRLWQARFAVEGELDHEETTKQRERIRILKELLAVDPKNSDYVLAIRKGEMMWPEFPAEAFPASPPEEAVGDEESPA